ncbi:MAG TPA: phosphate acyltransferase PlsX [Bacteroidales bacterium]|nr:phosphate acyltransferase PlsX [Bacteroidales bacterium]HPT02065.1 phosphate acyltransferase PlsX [Bacteroidales bacterium]
MKIGLDVMGGDFAPGAVIGGAILALKELPSSDRIVLIGPGEVISAHLSDAGISPDLFDIVHAPDVIGMSEHPTKALSRKPASTIGVGFNMLKHKQLDAFAGAGNSGAMLVGSIFSVNSIQGIIRPATPAFVPQENGGISVLIDVGTNPDARPDAMQQFALLGSLFASHVLKIENPRVGLLNIGEEEEKGNLTAQAVYHLLKGWEEINFIGNVEGRDLLRNKADVVVCDGFTGNIVLKSIESMYRIMAKRKLLDDYFSRFNYENYGGTPILGINGIVIMGHGISNDIAIKNMILMGRDIYESRLVAKIKHSLVDIAGKTNMASAL